MKNFLKPPAHQHRDPEVRLSHVRSLGARTGEESDDVETRQVLAALARSDDDERVRVAAIERTADGGVLIEVAKEATGSPGIATAVLERVASLLEAQRFDESLLGVLIEVDAPGFAPLVAARASDAELRARALALVDDEHELVRIVQGARFHEARLGAAERLVSHDGMRQALQASRTRDKLVARVLQQRLDEAAAAESTRIAAMHAVSTTLESMRQLADSVWSPQHAARRQALIERWRTLDPEYRTDAEADFEAAAERVRVTVEAHVPAVDQGRDGGTADEGADRDATAGTGAAADGTGDGDVANGTGVAAGSDAASGTSAGSTDAASGEAGAWQDAAAGGDESPAADAPAAAPPPLDMDAPALALLERIGPVPLDGLVEAVAQLDADPVEGREGSPAAQAIGAHAAAVAVLFDPPFELAGARPGIVEQRLRRIGSLLDTGALLPGVPVEKLGWLAALGEHRDALAARLEQSKQESADRLRATQRQFGALGGLIKEGKWAPATSLFRRIRKKIDAMEPAERRGVEDRLQRAEKQLAEMADWQDFAARPKLVEVVERMEALAAAELAPEARAKAVRELQSEWKSLGSSRVSNELWPRFKSAADAAYEPCKAWFEERAAQREGKHAARVALVEELEAAIAAGEAGRKPGDGADAPDESDAKADAGAQGESGAEADAGAQGEGGTEADSGAQGEGEGGTEADAGAQGGAGADAAPEAPIDHREIQRRLSRARQLWTNNRVRDRKPDKALERRFTAALKPFEDALAGEYERNAAEKRELIEKITALAEGEINQHVANQAKRLQSAWKLVGITRRKEDQALWEEFNAQSRKIFDQRREADRAQKKSELAHVHRGREIVDELRKLSRRDAVEEAEVQALSNEFDALAEFPERDKKGLTRAYREALDGVSRQRDVAKKRRRQAGVEEQRRLVELCERVERAVEDMSRSGQGDTDDSGAADAAERQALRDDVVDAWGASDVSVPRETMARLEARRDAALALLEAGGEPDWAANEEARRDLLIRMEVAAGVDTPPEDGARRMRYQLENLQAGMTSSSVVDSRAVLAQLEQDWIAGPPVKAAVHDSLESRYLKALGR